MADIHRRIEAGAHVTFTADTEKGIAWMGQHYNETAVRFSLAKLSERAWAERFVKRATDAHLTVSDR